MRTLFSIPEQHNHNSACCTIRILTSAVKFWAFVKHMLVHHIPFGFCEEVYCKNEPCTEFCYMDAC